MNTTRKDLITFVRWQDKQLVVAFKKPLDLLGEKAKRYSRYQPKRPTDADRKQYLEEVLGMCGLQSTDGLKPNWT